MEAKHTPGPWEANCFLVTGPDGIDVAHTGLIGRVRPGAESEANARRIVAAVNACDGIATEALETGAVKDLLAACKDALATGERDLQHVLDNGRLRDVMLAAIAKAEGQ